MTIVKHRPYVLSPDDLSKWVQTPTDPNFLFRFRGQTIGFSHGEWTALNGVLDFCHSPNDRTWYSTITDATLHPQGIVWKDNPLRYHERFGETYVCDDDLKNAMGHLTKSDDCLINSIQPHTWSYCHWILEALPKIVLSEKLKLPGRIAINDCRFARQAMDLMGIQSSRVRYVLRDDPPVAAPQITVFNGIPFEEISRDAIETIRDAFDVPSAEGDIGILIDRTDYRESRVRRWTRRALRRPSWTAPRTLLNQGAVLAALRRQIAGLPWMVFSPSTPFDEMVRMFGRAKWIVAPHGAGLANMIFAPRGTRVLELMPSNNPCNFMVLSHCLGNPYRCLPVAPGSNDKDVAFRVAPADISDQIERLT